MIKKYLMIYDIINSLLPCGEDVCMLCLYSEPVKYLITICGWNKGIKVNCFKKLPDKYKDNCRVCLKKYRVNDKCYNGVGIKDDRIYFPYNDIYYIPLMNDKYVKVEKISKLVFAIMYLQVDRVKELLEEKEILDELSNYTNSYGQTLIGMLAEGNMPTNYHISLGDNNVKYMQILVMLLKVNRINLDHKDSFGRTATDNANKHGYILISEYIRIYKATHDH